MAKLQLPPDFSEFLNLLNSEGVEYLLLGGYAVAYYGVPRATGDMDIWFDPAPANTVRLVAVLRKFGLPAEITPEQLQVADRVFRIGHPPLRIELLTRISGLDFSEAFARRRIIDISGVPVSLIDRDDLLRNKRAAGRRKDLDDVDRLAGE